MPPEPAAEPGGWPAFLATLSGRSVAITLGLASARSAGPQQDAAGQQLLQVLRQIQPAQRGPLRPRCL